MSKHPYPDHVVEALKEQLSKGYGDLYVCTRDDSAWSYGTMSLDDFHRLDSDEDVIDDLANDMLEMLWDASRVETIEQRDELPMTAVVEDAFGAICVKYRHDAPPFGWLRITPSVEGGKHHHPPYLPAHVIYWGDTDE